MKRIFFVIAMLAFLPVIASAAPLSVPQGGTGVAGLLDGGVLIGNDTNQIKATYSPKVEFLTATSTTATSTFKGNVHMSGDVKWGNTTGILSAVHGFFTTLGVLSPLTFSNNAIGCQVASGSQDGCLSAADWARFDSASGGPSGLDGSFQFNNGGVLTGNESLYHSGGNVIAQLPNGGAFVVHGGSGGDTGEGGTLSFFAGQAGTISGGPGNIELVAGQGSSAGGSGGNIFLDGGRANFGAGNGGDVYLRPGEAYGTGVHGKVRIATQVSGPSVILNPAITGDQTFTFPDISGTFGLLEVSQVWSGDNTFSEGASATTTVSFGTAGDSTSHVCFNTKNTDGNDISFYFVGTTMVVENNSCQ